MRCGFSEVERVTEIEMDPSKQGNFHREGFPVVHGAGASNSSLRGMQGVIAQDFPSNELHDESWSEEGEHMTNQNVINVFRRAVNDKHRLERLIADAKNLPKVAWSKAVLWACASGHVEFLSTFIKGTPPGWGMFVQSAKDKDGFTALHRAVVAGQKEVVKLLTRKDPNIQTSFDCFAILHARTPEGWTPLHLAVAAGKADILCVLTEAYEWIAPAKSEWDFKDHLWLTPLHYAVLGKRLTEMGELLRWESYKRHVNAHDFYFRTPLHMAASDPEASIEVIITTPKVDINAVDCCYYTPLHWAVYVGNTEAVRSLVSLPLTSTIRATEEDVDGKVAFQIAIEKSAVDRKVSKDIEKLLLTCPEVRDQVEMLYRDRQVYVDGTNAILVGAALIASVTFGGWLQPPNPSGNGTRESNEEIRVFWATNSLSFFFSIATVLAGAGAVLPMEDAYIGLIVNKIRRALMLTCILLMCSVVFVLMAFSAAGLVSLRNVEVSYLKEDMIVTTTIGSIVSLIVLTQFFIRLYKIRPDWRQFYQWAMTGRDRVWTYEEIDETLEHAKNSARQEKEKHGIHQEKDIRGMDLTELVENLHEASRRAMQVKMTPKDQRVPFGIHDRDKVLQQQILEFEEAYKSASSGSPKEAYYNMEVLSNVRPRGLHQWVKRYPASSCREHMREFDRTRWNRIHAKVQEKSLALDEECRRFGYGSLTFDEWSA